jgi:hypothetical protein
MTQFISLPSGLVVNLELVNRMVPSDEQGEPVLTVHFSTGDFVILRSEDASELRSRAGIQGVVLSPQRQNHRLLGDNRSRCGPGLGGYTHCPAVNKGEASC